MNAIAPISATNKRAPFRVDPSAGSHDGTVSTQWISRSADQRFLSLDDLYDYKKNFWENSFQTRMDTNEFMISAPEPETQADMHKLSIGVKVDSGDVVRHHEVVPTHWSFGQLCQLAKTPARLMRELPTQIGKDVINWRMRHAREVETVKLYGNTESLYAATGPDYGRIPDFEVAAAVRNFAGSGHGENRWKIPGVLDWQTHMYDPEAPVTKDSTTLFASDRDLFIFLVDDRNPIEVGKLKTGEPDLMFRGFYIQNSEVGSRSLKLAAFYLRAVCANRCLWGVEGFEELTIIHSRAAIDRWVTEAQPALRSFAEGSDRKLIEGVATAKAAKIADDDESALDFLQTRAKFSLPVAEKILSTGLAAEEEPVRSAWSFAQAITAYARDVPNTDDRMTIEAEARKILDRATGVRQAA